MHAAQVYAAAALIEWHGEKADTVPRKIFELGLQSFEAVAEYVLTYAEFLWGLGDYDNMRARFERALAADSKTKKLWDRYIQVRPPNQNHWTCICCGKSSFCEDSEAGRSGAATTCICCADGV